MSPTNTDTDMPENTKTVEKTTDMHKTADARDDRKRRRDQEEASDSSDSDSQNSNDEEQERETVDVDFDFNDPRPIDFHGIKTLMRQTFAADMEKIDASALADAIIDQAQVGSTVKVDDANDADPYALLTVMNLTHHAKTEWARQLSNYFLEKCSAKSEARKKLSDILADTSAHVGFVINERLINMPPQIAPPLFKLLRDEIQDALSQKQPFAFKYLVFVSKVYKEVESTVDEEDNQDQETIQQPQRKKNKSKKKALSGPIDAALFYFQPEDEIISRHAIVSVDYRLPSDQSSDSRRAFYDFGIEPSRRLMVVEFDKLDRIIEEMDNMLGSS